MNKPLRAISDLYASVAAQSAVAHFRQHAWPQVEKFLIAGPTLVGFLIGILKYPPRHAAFEVAFQSLVIFSGYVAALVAVQALDSLFFNSWPLFLGVSRSLLATGYLALTATQYLP